MFMVDNLKEIPKKLLEWWNKFTSRQKTMIIAAAAGILIVFAIIIWAVSQPQYEVLVTCESTKEAAEITDLLKEEYTYKTSEDGYIVYVLKDQISQARLLLGANNIPADAYDIDNVTSGGIGTTEADKQKRYKLYQESQLEVDLKSMDNVKNAVVKLDIPESTGTLIEKEEDSSAAIIITPDGEFTADHAATVAQFVRTSLGNEEIKNITIIDNEGNLLFSGDESYSVTGNATSQLNVKQQTELALQSEVKRVLLGTNEFDMIEVRPNLTLDFSTTETVQHDYTPADGQTQGVLSHEDTYSAESTGGTTGVPGTTSNGEDGTTYVIENGDTSSSTVTEESRDYLPNEKVTTTTTPPGLVKYDQSSLSISAIRYKVLKEEDAKSQGLLDGISWDEYKLANAERTKLEVDEELIQMAANASGINAEDITFVAYEEPMYVDKEAMDIEASSVAQVVLIVVILALLAFVILRSMRGEKVEEVEEELSVESLLQSTPETELESIELETKSETRKLIEKFVDENPEAAALLLRNWLNEDWS